MFMAYDPTRSRSPYGARRAPPPRAVPLETALALRDQAEAARRGEDEVRAAYRELARRHERLKQELRTLRAQPAPEPPPAPEPVVVEVPVEDERLEEAEQQLAELRGDLSNLRRHQAGVVARAQRDARAEGLLAVADSLDDLERALRELPAGHVADGVAVVAERLRRRLEEAGVVVSTAVGDPFDPEQHEAIGLTAGPRGTVRSVERRGLAWVDGPIIRPALVVVGAGRS